MANTDVTIRMDETTKTELQNLMNDLGMDVNTFFIVVLLNHVACKYINDL